MYVIRNKWRLKPRHSFVPAAQQLIILSDNDNIRAAQWADHQITDGMPSERTALKDSVFLFPTPATPPGVTLPRTIVSVLTPSALVSDFPFLLVQMLYGLLCGLRVACRRTNRRICCLPMCNPSTSSWTARPTGVGGGGAVGDFTNMAPKIKV